MSADTCEGLDRPLRIDCTHLRDEANLVRFEQPPWKSGHIHKHGVLQ